MISFSGRVRTVDQSPNASNQINMNTWGAAVRLYQCPQGENPSPSMEPGYRPAQAARTQPLELGS